jgi:orotidine-5'-phosphate decarboxylase
MTQYWPFSGLIRQGALRDRLIVSLDLGDRREALQLVDRLARVVAMFKVGRGLFVSGGPDFIREIRRRGAEVFLDLKFHDTPRNVPRVAVEATRLGVKMFDIHASSSPACLTDMMTRTRAEVSRVCRTEGLRRPNILAVAMLASVSPAQPRLVGPPGRDTGCAERVAQIARLAADAALDGIVTSPHQISRVRNICGRRFVIVTSGVSLREINDGQSQMMSAADAIRAGADFVVIGAPVSRATEPVRAVREITDRIEQGLRANPRGVLELQNPRPL